MGNDLADDLVRAPKRRQLQMCSLSDEVTSYTMRVAVLSEEIEALI